MCVGEYGAKEKTQRPHYHLIIFGYFPNDAILDYTENGNRYLISETLSKIWGRGRLQVCDTSPATMKYVAQYCEKKVGKEKADEIKKETGLGPYERLITESGEIIAVEPEYGTMSLKPGIGGNWFKKYSNDLYSSDCAVTPGGHINAVPGYYDKLLEESDADRYEKIRESRKAFAISKKKLIDDLDERLAVLDTCAKAKLKNRYPTRR